MVKIGDKIKFCEEKQRYTVQACDGRFAILTKPFNVRKTFFYTITDLKRGVRGCVNLIFGPNDELNTLDGAANTLEALQNGDIEVSYRNVVKLTESELEQLNA